MHKSTRTATIAFVALSALSALSAEARAQDTIRAPLDTLAITITRTPRTLTSTPAAVSVLTRDRIQGAKATLGLDESLVEVPGVLVNNRYNFAQGPRISVRGFGSRAAFGVRGVRIIADGIPLTMPDGQANLNNVDLASAGRIEVLRGPAAMLYGNAAGGVIAIITERPIPDFVAEGRVTVGDLGRGSADNLRKYNVKASGGNEATRYLVSGSITQASGYRLHSRFQQNSVNARVDRAHSGHAAHTGFTLNWADSPFAEDPGGLPRDSAQRYPTAAWPRNVSTQAGKVGEQIQAGLLHERNFAGAQLSTSVYGVRRTLENPQTFAYIDLQRSAGGVRTTLAWPHLLFGVDADVQRDLRNEFTNPSGTPATRTRDQTDHVSSVGPFARAEFNFGQLTATAGARYDHFHFSIDDRFLSDGRDDSSRRTLSALSPSAGVTYQIAPRQTAYASVATSFQTPTTTEINNSIDPLDPERSLAFEIGYRGHIANTFSFDAALYRTRIKDALVPFQIPTAPGRSFFRNAARTRHRGLELSGALRVTSKVELATSYTYSDFVFEDDGLPAQQFEQHQLPGVPPHHLFSRAAISVGRISLQPELEWTASYFADDANTPTARNDAFVLTNLRAIAPLMLQQNEVQIFGAINNIANERYNSSVVINATGARYFEPAPGRNFYLGLQVRLGQTRLRQ